MKPTAAFCLGFFLALTFYWGAMTLSGFDWSSHWKLAHNSAEAEAIVARLEPYNHCLAHYEFEVAGRRYLGSGSACSANVGDELHVYYRPEDPTFSTLKQPGSDLAFVIAAPLALSIIAGLVVMIRIGRPKESRQS